MARHRLTLGGRAQVAEALYTTGRGRRQRSVRLVAPGRSYAGVAREQQAGVVFVDLLGGGW